MIFAIETSCDETSTAVLRLDGKFLSHFIVNQQNHKKFGEVVCAWVQAREGSSLTPDEVQDYCQGQITHFKIPKHIKIVAEFPMTVTGKMQKFIMCDQYAEELSVF